MVNESGRSTWTADVKNVDTYDAIDDIPMDERVHRVELKYLDGSYGVAAWYSLKVDGSIVAERSTTINSKAWRAAPLAMLLDDILGTERFESVDDLLD